MKRKVAHHRIVNGAKAKTAARPTPRFTRLTLMLEDNEINRSLVNRIGTYAETQLPHAIGYRVLKCSTETIHSIDNYGTPEPELPRPVRPARL